MWLGSAWAVPPALVAAAYPLYVWAFETLAEPSIRVALILPLALVACGFLIALGIHILRTSMYAWNEYRRGTTSGFFPVYWALFVTLAVEATAAAILFIRDGLIPGLIVSAVALLPAGATLLVKTSRPY